MSSPRSRGNRGPAAAAGNRRALLDAARRVFAERGYRAPLSAIAREAGVGQGVLYRHFPTRLDLALAVFEENFAELEAIATRPDPRAFVDLWSRLVDITITESAFVEMAVDARRSLVGRHDDDRLRDLVAGALTRAQEAGLVDPAVSADDVVLMHRMIFGVVVTSVEHDDAAVHAAVDRATALLRRDPGAVTAPR
ncbi:MULTISPECIES: TetR/AcrR family transcriptional regulator [unclassified Actinotalea]|uniref:TetR/AcrR family transcriptional regulator n=1 Tax=unclassified Actinotalea TaxID=2638618 RepID=UPI0015F719ED|nr:MULTISPECIES: TetR/AcrR family transcriptional regulator [unclassified Actinotalea]